MRLRATVGILGTPNISGNDSANHANNQAAAAVRDGFIARLEEVHRRLRQAGLPRRREPTDCEPWSGEPFPEQDFHRLRRFAAHLALCGKPPLLSAAPPTNDALLREYCKTVPVSPQPFEHLVARLDWRGCYAPLDFERSIAPDAADETEIIGSAWRLREECESLALALRIPSDESPEETLRRLGQASNEPSRPREYPGESRVCAALLQACERSLNSGAILWCVAEKIS
ncbi:MAG: hypothetical protein N2C14_27730 [Planctomycetales bacterium]